MSLASDIDDRTIKEQIEDLNVEIIRTGRPKITGVSWVKRACMARRAGRKPLKPFINFARYGLAFSVRATELLGVEDKKYSFGVADFQQGTATAKKVLLLREDEKGYKITVTRRGYGANQAPGLIRQLQTAGLSHGRYELVQVNDGWMGVPE